jgi:hypothetical protein
MMESTKPRPQSSPLPRISDKITPAKAQAGKYSRQGSRNFTSTAFPHSTQTAKTECLAMYEFNRIVHGKVKQISDYFLFMCGAKNGQYRFDSIEFLFENPIYFSRPSHADHQHHTMLQWLGKIISKCGYSAEAWFQSVSLDNEAIFFNEFSASVLLLSVQCREVLLSEHYVKQLFAFITNSTEKLYFTRHDFAFAFRRMRLSSDEMNKMNQTAMLITELCGFLGSRQLSLRDFRLRMVQQQIQHDADNSPSKVYQVGGAGAAGGPTVTSHTHSQHHHKQQHQHQQQHRPVPARRDSMQFEDGQQYEQQHRYADPAVRSAMESIGISECEALLTVMYNYQGRKTGAMPSTSPGRHSSHQQLTGPFGDYPESPMRVYLPSERIGTPQGADERRSSGPSRQSSPHRRSRTKTADPATSSSQPILVSFDSRPSTGAAEPAAHGSNRIVLPKSQSAFPSMATQARPFTSPPVGSSTTKLLPPRGASLRK